MKHRRGWKRVIVAVIFTALFSNVSRAEEPNSTRGDLTGEVRYIYRYIFVDGDRGRFREDNWITDRDTWGIDWLHLENKPANEDEYKIVLEGRAVYDYDYEMSLLAKKEDHYFKVDFSGFRRYFDGSNEFWRASVRQLAERPDGDFFVDRRNYNIELGLTPPDKPHLILGWHRLEKDGKEVLLRGSRGVDINGQTNRSVPDFLNMRGVTDTFYGEIAHTFAEKYNLRVRQEFEQYHDKQTGPQFSTFDAAGNLEENEHIIDDLGYTYWRTMVLFDSFLDEKTYFTANYLYNYLNNDSTRKNFDPDPFIDELDVSNSKRTNVVGTAFRRTDALRVKGLDLSAGVRVEDSKTDADSIWFSGALQKTQSNLDEVRVAETLRLIYKGIKKTTLSFDASLEQRYLDWDANDTRDRNGFVRKTDIDFIDQIYTFKAVHRFNPTVKSTASFKYKNLERSAINLFRVNPNPFDYPGFIEDYRITANEALLKTDFRINRNTTTTLLYQFIQESFNFHVGGKTSNQEIHRGAGSLSFSPTQNMVLVGTFMLENRVIDTPINPAPGTQVAPGPQQWDFRGNNYSLLLDGTYAFNEKTSATFGFQHTEAMGTVGDAGDYVYNKVGTTLKRQISESQAVSAGYFFWNFNNHGGGDFDDYKAHGVAVTYDFRF